MRQDTTSLSDLKSYLRGPVGESQAHGWFNKFMPVQDMANVIAALESIVGARYERDILSNPAFNPSLPPIFSSFMPKSGGTFLYNRLREAGYLEYHWGQHRATSLANYSAIPAAVALYQRGGVTAHTHAFAHPQPLAALRDAGVEKIWLHLRNPAETVISAHYHFQGQGHGQGELAIERAQLARQEAERLKLPSDIDEMVRRELGFFVTWIQTWAEHHELYPDSVVASYHHELTDPVGVLRRVYAEMGHDCPVSDVTTENLPQDRRRTNGAWDWRSELKPETVDFAENLIREGLHRYPLLEPLWRE